MRSGSVGLGPEFFASDTWEEPRVFCNQEATLDLLACACFGVPGRPDGLLDEYDRLQRSDRILALRWRWPRWRVAEFLATQEVVDVEDGRYLVPRRKVAGVRVPTASKLAPKRVGENVAADLHAIWRGAFASAATLTPMRREKYEAFWVEHVHDGVDGYALFGAVCDAVKASPYHMGDKSYHTPESILRNPERRDRWVRVATEGQSRFVDANTASDLKKFAGDVPVAATRKGPDTSTPEARRELLDWYNAQNERVQARILEEKSRRYAFSPVKDRAIEVECFYGILSEMKDGS